MICTSDDEFSGSCRVIERIDVGYYAITVPSRPSKISPQHSPKHYVMFRPRLRSTRGCIRCKKRHVKCDEARPVCSFCKNWNLPCVWTQTGVNPTIKKVATQHQPPSDASCHNASYHRPLVLYRKPECQKQSIDPFHEFPLSLDPHEGQIAMYLHQYFVTVTEQNLPFEDVGLPNVLAQGWFESAMSDQIVCYALLTHWATHQVRAVESPENRLLSLKFENRTTSLLRHHIESDSLITEGILLAAAKHCLFVAFNVRNQAQLTLLLRGIKTLVRGWECQGQAFADMRPSTVFSLQHIDMFHSLVTAKKMQFAKLDVLHRPSSFSSVYRQTDLCSFFVHANILEADAFHAVENINFLLYFRMPSKQTRGLSREEVRYLHALEHWTTYQLCLLQHKYAGSGTVNEVMAISLVLMKIEIVAETSNHELLVHAVLARLRAAISSYDFFSRALDQTTNGFGPLAIWACFVTMVGSILPEQRVWFIDFAQEILNQRYGTGPTDWLPDVERQLKDEMNQFPWHSRLNGCLYRICTERRNEPLLGSRTF